MLWVHTIVLFISPWIYWWNFLVLIAFVFPFVFICDVYTLFTHKPCSKHLNWVKDLIMFFSVFQPIILTTDTKACAIVQSNKKCIIFHPHTTGFPEHPLIDSKLCLLFLPAGCFCTVQRSLKPNGGGEIREFLWCEFKEITAAMRGSRHLLILFMCVCSLSRVHLLRI